MMDGAATRCAVLESLLLTTLVATNIATFFYDAWANRVAERFRARVVTAAQR